MRFVYGQNTPPMNLSKTIISDSGQEMEEIPDKICLICFFLYHNSRLKFASKGIYYIYNRTHHCDGAHRVCWTVNQTNHCHPTKKTAMINTLLSTEQAETTEIWFVYLVLWLGPFGLRHFVKHRFCKTSFARFDASCGFCFFLIWGKCLDMTGIFPVHTLSGGGWNIFGCSCGTDQSHTLSTADGQNLPRRFVLKNKSLQCWNVIAYKVCLTSSFAKKTNRNFTMRISWNWFSMQ